MNDVFEIPVTYRGKDLFFPAELLPTGYTHKFRVDVYGQEIFFEPDEERKYRALMDPEAQEENVNVDLLKAIADAIEKILA